MTPIYNYNHLQGLYIVRLRSYSFRKNPNYHTARYVHALGDSRKEKFPFNRKKSPPDPTQEGPAPAATGCGWQENYTQYFSTHTESHCIVSPQFIVITLLSLSYLGLKHSPLIACTTGAVCQF